MSSTATPILYSPRPSGVLHPGRGQIFRHSVAGKFDGDGSELLEVSEMSHSALIMLIGLIGILPYFKMPQAQQPMPLLTIDFSLDSKDGREMGHISVYYSLTREGREFDVRNVYGCAAQNSDRRELSTGVVAKITRLLRGLPNSEESNIPKDGLVTITFRDGDEFRVREYYRKRLPRSLREALELLGGIRFELKDTMGFLRTEFAEGKGH